ncbi:MAG: gluconate 2-dehydrogenase subunit 3 family protein [Gammaproteobacteria bacterium]
MARVTRRSFVTTVGAATVVPAAALLSATAQAVAATAKSPLTTEPDRITYLFFNAEQAFFIEAACERLIPADESGPGALGAGVPNYIDKQLGGAWGAGERLHRSGPWQAGTPTQGYQLPFTPAELFHASLRAINRDLAAHGTPFHDMVGEAQDAYLKSLESGAHDLDGVPSAIFFDVLLKMTVEGFFSDPVYGGNRNMVAWRMIGFPGAYADYFEAVDKHGVKFEREPMSLAEDAHGHIHVRRDIPANL